MRPSGPFQPTHPTAATTTPPTSAEQAARASVMQIFVKTLTGVQARRLAPNNVHGPHALGSSGTLSRAAFDAPTTPSHNGKYTCYRQIVGFRAFALGSTRFNRLRFCQGKR